jgi:hypothetical protein
MTFDIAMPTEVIVEKCVLRQLRNSGVIAYNVGKQFILRLFLRRRLEMRLSVSWPGQAQGTIPTA